MKLIFYVSEKLSGRGGMEKVLKDTYHALSNSDIEIQIIMATSSEDSTWEKNLPIKHLYSSLPKFKNYEHKIVLQKEKLNEIVMDYKPDYIVCLSAFSIRIAREVVQYVNSTALIFSWLHFSIHKEKFKDMLLLADGHLCISTEIVEQLKFETPEIPCELVFNPVQIGDSVIEKSSRPLFIYIGRLDNEQKRIDVLFKALSQVIGDWNLLIIGDGQDRNALENLSQELNIDLKIKWYGWLEEPWNVIKEATLLVLPSDYEGFGLVLVEALSRGVPVISSNCSTGPKDIIKHSNNGYLFKPGDDSELSSILNKVIKKEIILPDQNVCKDSVLEFDEKKFGLRFQTALVSLRDKLIRL